MKDDENINFFEKIGIVVIMILFTFLLGIPGMFIFDYKRVNLEEEVINNLCNNANGKYDFCQLIETTKTYKIKEIKTNE